MAGIIVGVASAIFLKALDVSVKFTNSYEFYFLLLPIGLGISTLLVMYLAPDAEGHGTEKVIESVHKRSGNIKLAVVPETCGNNSNYCFWGFCWEGKSVCSDRS